MNKLSPQAQAVLDAVRDNYEPYWDMQDLIAAALRAAADHLGEELEFYNARVIDTEDLLAIADELEKGNE